MSLPGAKRHLKDAKFFRWVDDNCEWNFSTSGSTLNPTISLNPSSGTVLPATSVTVTGNGFAPLSSVVITFEGSTVAQKFTPFTIQPI